MQHGCFIVAVHLEAVSHLNRNELFNNLCLFILFGTVEYFTWFQNYVF